MREILFVLIFVFLVANISANQSIQSNVVPYVNIDNLFVLEPISEPENAFIGMIYLDEFSNSLKFYDGEQWYYLAIEDSEPTEETELVCTPDKECVEWGDCINSYKTRECISIDVQCNKFTNTETKPCGDLAKKPEDSSIREENLSSKKENLKAENQGPETVKESSSENIDNSEKLENSSQEEESIPQESTNNEEPSQKNASDEEQVSDSEEQVVRDSPSQDISSNGGEREKLKEKPKKECHEVCDEVCEEDVCEDVCTEEESCSEDCSTDEEGNEVCEEVCEPQETCEEVCKPGECKDVCEEVCEIPEELFDVTFELDKDILDYEDNLSVLITLQNFGTRYVPARLVYVIKDKSGKEVYKGFEETRVYTDQVIRRDFDIGFDSGDYDIFMNVEYAGIVENFDLPFKVKYSFFKKIKLWFSKNFN